MESTEKNIKLGAVDDSPHLAPFLQSSEPSSSSSDLSAPDTRMTTPTTLKFRNRTKRVSRSDTVTNVQPVKQSPKERAPKSQNHCNNNKMDCLIQALDDAIMEDKENSRPTTRCQIMELMEASHQHGDADNDPPVRPLILRSYSPTLGDTTVENKQEDIAMMVHHHPTRLASTTDITTQTSHKPSSRMGSTTTVEEMLVATNTLLGQTNCQYEEYMVQQESQLRDLQAKLEKQAVEHSSALEQKEEDIRQILEETQKQMNKLDAQVCAFQKEIANAISEKEKEKQKCKRIAAILEARLKRNEKETALEQVKLREEMDAQLDELQKKLDDSQSKNVQYQQRMEQQENQLCRLQKQHENDTQLLEQKEEEMKSTLNRKSKETQEQMDKLRREKDAQLLTLNLELAAVRSESDRRKELMKSLGEHASTRIMELVQKEESLQAEINALKSELSHVQEAHEEIERRNAHYYLSQCVSNIQEERQEFETTKRAMDSLRTMYQGALEQQRRFSEENHQLRRDKLKIQQTMESRLEEMKEEMYQMQMNHAMEHGFWTG